MSENTALLANIQKVRNERYRKDPLYWLEHRFGEDPKGFEWSVIPGYENHTWDGSMDPLANAWRELAKGNWVGIEAGTGTSKTYWLSRLVFWYLDCYEDSLVVTSAPKQEQLKLHLWSEIGKAMRKFKALRPDCNHLNLKLKVQGGDDEEDDFTDSWMAVGFVAGTGADEKSATKAQGFHRNTC